MKQKIKVIAMLCVLVAILVGAYFLYDSLTADGHGGQLAVIGGGSSSDTNNPSSNDEKLQSSDSSADSNKDGNQTTAPEPNPGSDAEPDHDHSEENNDHGNLIKAYDFAVYDVNGNKVKLSDFFGKPIVLNFWASWCGPCRSEMPAFDEVYSEYKDKIHFLMVSVDDTMNDAKKFITTNGYSLPIYHDSDFEGSKAYGVSSIPVTYFIDKSGYLVVYGNFPFNKATLLQGINMIYTP